MKLLPIVVPDPSRFWAKVRKAGPKDCWIWLGAYTGDGSPTFSAAGRKYVAPRVAWFLANGRQPDGLVCHSCDNPPCVNPDHLWLGTQSDNMRDMVAKCRWRCGPHSLRSKDYCANGHKRTAETTALRRGTRTRICRVCDRERHARLAARRRTS